MLCARPIKSVYSPTVPRITVGWQGVINDRTVVAVDPQTGQVITAKEPGGQWLLECRSWVDDGGKILLHVPGYDKAYPWSNRLISLYLREVLRGRNIDLVRVTDSPKPMATNARFSLRPGVGYDSSPFSWVTTAALDTAGSLYPNPGAYDPRRLRMTGVIESPKGITTSFPEDAWVGHRLRFPSGVEMMVRKRTERCGLPTRSQAQHGLTADVGMLAALTKHHAKALGVYCSLVEPGMGVIEEGDEIELI
ncbi:MAG TPA: hypothetical protein VMT30_08005 [Candidatus Saccharimonadia bacterium]|nr:hypothetical protein [Candidatus Saccharimonadia bacterium]